ncbi:LexA family transcriptional regulator [Petrimonas sp.]|uniref:LexA family transcriptional regulator n=1 Tax=Petrimonas sp. TaxID=2023866 RepID=UPI002FC98898
MENVIDRVKKLMEEYSINENDFSKKIGIKQRTVNYYLNKERKPSLDFITNIYNSYPDVNADWLISGRGEMLKQPEKEVKQIYSPKVKDKFQIDPVPLYDIDAAANLKTLFENKKQNIIGMVWVPNMPVVDGAMFVRGDSMYPILKAGDIIVYKEVSEFQYVIYGEMYVVSWKWDGDEFVNVKYISRSEKEDHIKLISYNTYHEPMDIPVSLIQAMALVKISIRYNTVK